MLGDSGGLVILLIGANHRIMRCNVLVVSEQITPRIHSSTTDTNTVCSAVLAKHQYRDPISRYISCHIRRISILPINQIRIHADTGQQHLTNGICHARHPGRLTQEIAPALNPGKYWHLLRGHDMFGDKVHPARRGICRDQLGHGAPNAHRHAGTDQPAPDRCRRAAG